MVAYSCQFDEEQDPDPHQTEKRDPDPHRSVNSRVMEAQDKAVEGRRRSQWGVEAQNEALEVRCRPMIADSYHLDEEQDPDPSQTGKGIRIRIRVERIEPVLTLR
jgi:hypothetical protein